MTIRPLFAWYDLWIGAFWDRKARKLYVLPLPCIGFVVHIPEKQQEHERLVAFEKLYPGITRKARRAGFRVHVLRNEGSYARPYVTEMLCVEGVADGHPREMTVALPSDGPGQLLAMRQFCDCVHRLMGDE
jgi:hypothetical protein